MAGCCFVIDLLALSFLTKQDFPGMDYFCAARVEH